MRRAEPGRVALIGPPGWLPDVERYELVGLRVTGQYLRVERIDEDVLPSPEQQLRVREMLSSIYTRECDYATVDDLTKRPAMLARTISLALLEDPCLFGAPYPPLDELLHNPLETRVDLEHWRDVASLAAVRDRRLLIDGMPIVLRMELTARARDCGMTDAQLHRGHARHARLAHPLRRRHGTLDDWVTEGVTK